MTTTHRYKAAVIIPSRGGADILHYPLDALAAQTEKDFQVIVVLDGDIDNSEAVLDRYIAEGKLNLTKIVFEENRGRVAALNAGHRAADADVLIRCDDDLEPASDYVEAQIRLHRDYDGVIGTLKNVYPDTPYSRVYGNFRDARFKEGALSVAEEGRWLYWNGNSSISAEYFERTGGYDPAYRLYGWEDVDMGKMVHDAGGRIIISDEVEVKHYAEATTTAVRALRALHSGSARTIFVRKHGEEAHPAPNPTGPWGLLVKTLARFTTEKTIKALGDASDKILLKLPAKAAEKLVALQVEAASYAGIHYPERAQKVF
ncbi:glycosyl transferase [Rothia sp. HMSC072B04]|jgi:glycosyltransferase, group 2 family|uniref:glycosyltransferase family 2 protein n=1 Tax=Rothia TaxID=32207 RepID=UPI00066CE780|nr:MULTISPECIES: glycosyltransferase family A protein [Rothia]MBF1654847.1 glycosyltransferase family 2 protein [Rothia sp. (in: high G+C Gram-positive bacteria)]MBF1680873.1 glycosyltransferase family 2 protein [Rothia sp. (in: high G+C Gram-positive bacteria)]OFJ76575.1 glycosyl transferase [Rothia sp. HMSC065B04]OFJ78179.1 glycosyl transferase [Rothia sp. HMSC069C10]OFP78207.1 glycosyl transferase [Rothia sp. HMSC066G07]